MKKARREAARARLEELLSSHPPTQGMYVRIWGDHLIIGRQEPFGPDGEMEADDRLRLTVLNHSSFGLSVRRHTGRWERTPFTGTLEELVDIIGSLMQHIVAPYA
jgi:hypothetical protein